jgi:hypothetical protein
LVHWVSEHSRLNRRTMLRDIHVRAHVRGESVINAFGYRCTIRPPKLSELTAHKARTENMRQVVMGVMKKSEEMGQERAHAS